MNLVTVQTDHQVVCLKLFVKLNNMKMLTIELCIVPFSIEYPIENGFGSGTKRITFKHSFFVSH